MPTTPSGAIRLFVLGDARIETPVAVIEPSAELAFATALYFLLERKEPISRRALERLLWPDVASTTASHRLRQTLLKLRRLGLPVETVGTARLRLPPDLALVDLEDLVATPRQIDRVAASHLVVLPHYEPKVSDQYTDWLETKKHEIGSRLVTPLLSIISKHRHRANWDEVESWATALLRLAPHNEEATLALAEAHAMRGAKLEGVRVLDGYLAEIGEATVDIRLPATVMRKRIADRMPPRPNQGSPDAPIIGRGDTINTLSEMLPSVRAGSGQSCLVYGDAGIGKSRVFAEFANFAALQGLTCVRVQCRPNDSFRPLSVFVDLVPQLRAMRGAIGCSPDTMKHLDRLTTHNQRPLSSISLQGDAVFAYAKVQLAVADLIDAVAEESPILILVEDVQRLDDASATLLTDLIPWSADKRVLFAFTSRDCRIRWIEALTSQMRLIKLRPLDEHSARQVMVGKVEQLGSVISEDYLSWCTRIAEGNPYFLTELASHWVQTGERQGAPPSLTAVIEQRLSMLDQPALQLLQACALLEKNATLDRIERTLGYPLHQLLSSITELSSLGMIVLESNEGAFEKSARLSPRHELLANAAENRLAPPAKAFLHRRIGVVLESETDDKNSSAILWDCAKHWRLAGDFDQAFAVARSCTTHLMDLGLCTEAAQAYEKAFAFCASDSQRLEILQGQAHAYFRASDWQNLSSAASKSRELQSRLHTGVDIHDDVELMEIRATWQRGQQVGTIKRTLGCLNDGRATLDHRCRAGIMALMLMDWTCDFDAMATTYGILRPLLEDNGADQSHRFEAGMVFETICGDLSAVLPLAQQLVSARLTCESIADLMRALTNAASAARTAGHFPEAKAWLNEAIAIAGSHRLPLATEVPMQIFASMALDDNDVEQAKNWHSRLLGLPRSNYDYDIESKKVYTDIGLRIALSERDIKTARSLARSDIRALASDPTAYSRTYGLALFVAVQLADGEIPDERTTNLLEISYLITRKSPRQGFATFILVTALRRRGEKKRASRLLREYLDECRREPSPAPLHILELFESFPVGLACD
jgi:DNA-binding SARP family transcriptional activator/tetratricopeptide (TPR) repeat protein